MTFSISDLDNPPDTSDLAVEDSVEAAAPEPTFPVRASLNITKSGSSGALVMDLLVEDEAFIIDNASFYSDKSLAEDLTAEGDWKRRGTYVGPRFDHLDEEVQSQFEQFLEERDVNANLGEQKDESVLLKSRLTLRSSSHVHSSVLRIQGAKGTEIRDESRYADLIFNA